MKKIASVAFSMMLIFTLTSCGYDGGYRYPCQDPANWENAECNPPVCETTGTCSKDIIGEKAWTDYQNSKVKNG